jgi:hypothetical protein
MNCRPRAASTLLLKILIGNREVVLGAIYGPNSNDLDFYTNLKNQLNMLGGTFIIGGDFNTILDRQVGEENMDKEGGGRRIPNLANSNVINEWIDEGFVIEPFRALYPEKKEYSYVSFRQGNGGWQHGKTRLDFFLISPALMNEISKVVYEDRISSDFDHREAVLTMGKKPVKGKITIYNSTIDHRYAEPMGLIGIYDALLTHLKTPDGKLNVIIGRGEQIMRELTEIIEINNTLGATEERNERIRRKEEEIERALGALPGVDELLTREYQCSKCTLYEVVVLNLKNRMTMLQAFLKRQHKLYRAELVRKIEEMCGRYGDISQQVQTAKENLSRYDNESLLTAAGKYADFLVKNYEKPTGAFCLLGKENNTYDDISQIKKENGENFADSKDRGEHIRRYYEGLYKKKLDIIFSIENFLTEGTCNEQWVQDRKLSQEEKDSLEGDITEEELTESLKKSNLSSSSGWDGVSYKLIKKFWGTLSKLTAGMANESFARGDLIETFKLGLIKLIRKKGIAERVGDWRPITLLSCGYKLISGEGGKIYGKNGGESTKGICDYKKHWTVTMNVIDRISESWKEREPMGLLCIDFVKAFDSIEHEFIEKVLKFFNFGERMIGYIRTLLYDRNARIILDEGCSESFSVKRGSPQGDRSSPYIFILCIEILLIKLESMDGKGIDQCNFIRREIAGIALTSSNSESYADDLTVLFKFCAHAMDVIMDVMRDFYRISGLEVNKSKTQLMVTGCDMVQAGTVIDNIEVVEKVTLLGIEIDRKITRIDTNWEKCLGKITRLCNFWRLQRLGVAGRLLVSKSYLLAQVTYFLGCIPLTREYGDRINEVMAQFMKGTDKILARDRWFLPAQLGGYDLIDVHILSTGIKSTWIKRWLKEKDTNPDYIGTMALNGNNVMDLIGGKTIEYAWAPCLGSIMEEWKRFKVNYYRTGRNALEALVFKNNGFFNANEEFVEETVFGSRKFVLLNQESNNVIERVKLGQLVAGGACKQKQDIEQVLGVNINQAEFFRLREQVERLTRDFVSGEKVGKRMEEFLGTKVKGCKKYRDVLVGKHSTWYEEQDPRNIGTVRNLCRGEEEQLDRQLVELNLGLWKTGPLSASYKNFLFKFVQGRLWFNAALSHFTDEQPWCTFCSIIAERELDERGITLEQPKYAYYLSLCPRETHQHIFWECEHVQPVIQTFFRNTVYVAETGFYKILGVEILRSQNVFWGT